MTVELNDHPQCWICRRYLSYDSAKGWYCPDHGNVQP